MTQLLKQAIERLRELPAVDQDMAAVELTSFVDRFDESQLQLSNEQLKEVGRRLARKNPKTLTLKQLDVHLKKRGV